MDAPESIPPNVPAAPKPKWPFVVASVLVVLPGLLALSGSDDAAVVGVLLVAPVASIAAGILLALRLGSTPGTKVLLSLVCIVVCLAASEGLAGAGCAASDFKLHIQ